MKDFTTSLITSTANGKMPKAAFEHLLNSYKETCDALIKAQIAPYDRTGQVVVLHGCVRTVTGSNYTVTAGAVYYNGEVYQVDAVASTLLPGGNVNVWAIVTTAANVVFTDNSAYPFLVDRKMRVTHGPAGGAGVTGYVADWKYAAGTSASGKKTMLAVSDLFSSVTTPTTPDAHRTLVWATTSIHAQKSSQFNEINAPINVKIDNATSFNNSGRVSFSLSLILKTEFLGETIGNSQVFSIPVKIYDSTGVCLAVGFAELTVSTTISVSLEIPNFTAVAGQIIFIPIRVLYSPNDL